MTHAQILDLYIALGGIPHYLKQIEPGKSAVQNINQSCFTKQGALFNEFSQLFESLFDKTGHHLKVVCTIAKTRNGISRNDLLQATKLNSGGIFNKLLNELEASGFVQKFIPYGKSIKEHYFRIIDEYTMFYLKWIAPIKTKSIALRSNYWHTKSKSAAWQSWAGYTFENICYKHINQIANKLNLMNISCIVSSWRYVPKIGSMQRGAQIDLLFDRDDQSITICEIKYNDSDFVINKQYALDILEKNRIFAEQINTKKQLFICFITKNKLKDNIWKQEIVNDVVTLDDLFTT
ncbi:MAG: hypothetical protein COC15_01520 [Legionellales bacterium]|nr:MAG: hypothetical protein COC15_01520 [Legionellales bacterium]